jgi:hypothetical protein
METFAIEKHIPKTREEQGQISLAGCIMAGIGIALSLTGIGAIIGIPIVCAAISHSRRDMNTPKHIYEAPCPACGLLLHVPVTTPGSNCPACMKRFVVRGNYFVMVD